MFTNEIIQTYEPWYIDLSDGSKIECKITPGWEYMIDTTWKHNGNFYIKVVYNINNGYCKPYEAIENIRKEYEEVISKEKKKPYQTTIFDFIEEDYMNYFYYIDKGYITEQGDHVSYEADYYDNMKFEKMLDAVIYAHHSSHLLSENEYFEIMDSSGEFYGTIDHTVGGFNNCVYLIQGLNAMCQREYIYVSKGIFFKIFNSIIEKYENISLVKYPNLFIIELFDRKNTDEVLEMISYLK